MCRALVYALMALLVIGSVRAEEWGRKLVRDLVAQFPYYKDTMTYSGTRELLRQMPPEVRENYVMHQIIIYKNRLYETVPGDFPRFIWPVLRQLAYLTPLPNVYLVYVYKDELPYFITDNYIKKYGLGNDERERILGIFNKIPIIMCNKNTSSPLEKAVITPPDIYVTNETRYYHTMKSVEEGSREFPWEKKLAKAFWRGQPTGAKIYDHTHEQIMEDIPNLFTRAQLVQISKQHPELLDARLVVYDEGETQILKKLNWTDYRGDAVPIREHLRYKYLISVDGYSAAWERIPWILHAGCLLFKQQSTNVQWFYNRMLPGEHYVEVAHDLSDLAEKIQYYKEHDEEARAIAERGQKLAQEYLTHDAIVREYREILEEIAGVQKLRLTFYQELLLELQDDPDIFTLLDLQVLHYFYFCGGIVTSIALLTLCVYMCCCYRRRQHQILNDGEVSESSQFVKDEEP